MPRLSHLRRSTTCNNSISISTLAFLLPTAHPIQRSHQRQISSRSNSDECTLNGNSRRLEDFFFTSISHAPACSVHRSPDLSSLEYMKQCTPNTFCASRLGPATPVRVVAAKRKRPDITSRRFATLSRNAVDYRDPRSAMPSAHLSNTQVAAEDSTPGEFQKLSRSSVTQRRYTTPPYEKTSTGASERRSQGFFDHSDVLSSRTDEEQTTSMPKNGLRSQMNLLNTVRELEDKLAKARSHLQRSLNSNTKSAQSGDLVSEQPTSVILTKDDYLNLVDLYFYSHHSRFAPDSPDYSPTPLFLDNYSFKLSADFIKPTQRRSNFRDHVAETRTIFQQIQSSLKSGKLTEIAAMQSFVDVLLKDDSSSEDLFEAYRQLPEPGVSFLPAGVIRLFLQRMSTPEKKSKHAMMQYLSLIEDMQKAALPITSGEWSSAIYLAGRSFGRVSDEDIRRSFDLWREMEQNAGVEASHVTFNILFDLAVRADKFVLAEMMLNEMHERGLRLNRLGRVSLIYYHGKRGDGDAVRKAYHDFVEAGEIVDTLVLDCVMVSLIHAHEPVAAEQIYERMKNLQNRLKQPPVEGETGALFERYPPPGPTQLNMEMASNSLGRVLLNSARLKNILPNHHAHLQSTMPLRPSQVTYRNMIAYHACISGNLDRITVLMNDMSELFDLPFTTIHYKLLFKGFALHGGSPVAKAQWSVRALNMAWDSCRNAIKSGRNHSGGAPKPQSLSIPSVAEVNSKWADDSAGERQLSSTSPSENVTRKLRKPHFFSAESSASSEGMEQARSIRSPQFEDEQYRDSGYQLPGLLPSTPPARKIKHKVSATKGLVMWVIRAFARCTGSRTRVEEVWGQIRKVYTPLDGSEREQVVRVFQRALRDCSSNGRR